MNIFTHTHIYICTCLCVCLCAHMQLPTEPLPLLRYILFYSSIWKVSFFSSFSKSNWPFWRCAQNSLRLSVRLSAEHFRRSSIVSKKLWTLFAALLYFILWSNLLWSLAYIFTRQSGSKIKAEMKKNSTFTYTY